MAPEGQHTHLERRRVEMPPATPDAQVTPTAVSVKTRTTPLSKRGGARRRARNGRGGSMTCSTFPRSERPENAGACTWPPVGGDRGENATRSRQGWRPSSGRLQTVTTGATPGRAQPGNGTDGRFQEGSDTKKSEHARQGTNGMHAHMTIHRPTHPCLQQSHACIQLTHLWHPDIHGHRTNQSCIPPM